MCGSRVLTLYARKNDILDTFFEWYLTQDGAETENCFIDNDTDPIFADVSPATTNQTFGVQLEFMYGTTILTAITRANITVEAIADVGVWHDYSLPYFNPNGVWSTVINNSSANVIVRDESTQDVVALVTTGTCWESDNLSNYQFEKDPVESMNVTSRHYVAGVPDPSSNADEFTGNMPAQAPTERIVYTINS